MKGSEAWEDSWWTFLVIGSLIMVAKFIESIFIWKNRDFPVIKVRGIWNSLYINLAVVMIQLMAIICTAGNVPCGAFFVSSMFVFSFGIGCIIDRVIVLYAKFFITNEAQILVAQEFMNRNSASFHQQAQPVRKQTTTKLNIRGTNKLAKWIFNHRFMVDDIPFGGSKIAAVVGGFVMTGFMSAIYFPVLSKNPGSQFFTDECQADLDRGLGFVSFVEIVFLLVFAATWYVGRYVKENFLLKFEVNAVWVWMLELTTFFFLLARVPDFRGMLGSKPNVVIYGIQMQLYIFTLSMIPGSIMMYRVYKTLNPSSREESIELGDRQGSKAPHQITETMKTIQSLHQKLDLILEDAILRDAFHQFLVMEFCVENLLFVDQVDELMRHRELPRLPTESQEMLSESTVSPKPLTWEMLLKVYNLFCDPDSRLSINISHPTRQNLIQLFTTSTSTSAQMNSDELEDAMGTKIDKGLNFLMNARTEVIDLMAKDSVRRFLHSELYKQLTADAIQQTNANGLQNI
jgi:hypothetical protein